MTYKIDDDQKKQLREFFNSDEEFGSVSVQLLEFIMDESYLPEDGSRKFLVNVEIDLLKRINKKSSDLKRLTRKLHPHMYSRLSQLIGLDLRFTVPHQPTPSRWKPISIDCLLSLITEKTDSVIVDFTDNYRNRKADKPIGELINFWMVRLNREVDAMSEDGEFVHFVSILLRLSTEATRKLVARHPAIISLKEEKALQSNEK